MKLIKCPRCELNYITENEKICSVCKRDVKGEVEQDDLVELCSECGEHPAMPGQEICIYCFKEMQRRSEASSTDDNGGMEPEETSLSIDPVSTMDEIELDLDEDMGGESFAEDDDGFFGDDDDEDDEDDMSGEDR